MRERPAGDIIELIAKDPDGDLACDFTIAKDMARSGLREGLAAGIRMSAPSPQASRCCSPPMPGTACNVM